MEKLEVKGLGHISLYVDDLEKAKEFYTQVLGFEQICVSLGEDDHSTMCFYSDGDLTLELVGFEEPKKRQDGLIDHLCFRVDDIRRAVQILKEWGYALDEEIALDPCIYKNGGLFMIFRGPNGERLQLEQRL